MNHKAKEISSLVQSRIILKLNLLIKIDIAICIPTAYLLLLLILYAAI